MDKKILYIIIGVVVLAAVGYIAKTAMFKATGVDYSSNPLTGSQTYKTDEGSVTVGNSMPSSWPADAPDNYSGAQIVYSGDVSPTSGSKGAYVSYMVAGGDATAISNYYKESLVSKGWTIENTVDISGQIITSAKKDDRTFVVQVLDTGSGAITVTVGIELENKE